MYYMIQSPRHGSLRAYSIAPSCIFLNYLWYGLVMSNVFMIFFSDQLKVFIACYYGDESIPSDTPMIMRHGIMTNRSGTISVIYSFNCLTYDLNSPENYHINVSRNRKDILGFTRDNIDSISLTTKLFVYQHIYYPYHFYRWPFNLAFETKD